MTGTISSRLPCCFMVFYDYPNWRTGGSPFEPQVPSYLKTHIIHSFLTILNYKTVYACRSSIMNIPPVPNQPKRFKFPQRFFRQKNPVKRSFQSLWFADRTWLHYDEANDLAYCQVIMAAYRDGKLNSSNHVCFCPFFSSSWCRGLAAVCDCGIPWTFLLTVLIRRSYSMDFPTGEMLAWSLKTRLFQVPS